MRLHRHAHHFVVRVDELRAHLRGQAHRDVGLLEGEHRLVEVAGAEHTVKSLVIARPERCVVEALSNLKGNPPREEKTDEPVVITAPEPIVPPAIPNEAEDKHPALKKGKKS